MKGTCPSKGLSTGNGGERDVGLDCNGRDNGNGGAKTEASEVVPLHSEVPQLRTREVQFPMLPPQQEAAASASASQAALAGAEA
ncbi:hypothetical protein C1H46_007137 [Malus baccata]|uniref:Uncharacterized protein n=1 Tax=Malus baccata TaxID=106549 RepID=A0A540N864_MALBA|nr:hypothetical protein C1H46_007137 [Malus baccata]